MKNSRFDLKSLVRPNILEVTPYRCARDDYDQGILLDANENSYGAIVENSLSLHRYPDPRQIELKTKISEFRGCGIENIFVGVGSDEAIDLLIRIFCSPGKDNILITPPTYGMYAVSAKINDIVVKKAPLTPNFGYIAADTLNLVDQNTKIIFLCSPNNPTGNLLDPEEIMETLDRFKGIVVVDEAYIDFANSKSFVTYLSEYPNLVVLQTLSKSFGLAGTRVGMAFSSPKIIDLLNRIKPPYNLNNLSLNIGYQGFMNINLLSIRIGEILSQREYLITQLQKLTFVEHIFPSDSNFLLFRMQNAFSFYKWAAEKGVVSRYRGNEIHCQDCIRVTVGTPEENETFIKYLKEWNQKN